MAYPPEIWGALWWGALPLPFVDEQLSLTKPLRHSISHREVVVAAAYVLMAAGVKLAPTSAAMTLALHRQQQQRIITPLKSIIHRLVRGNIKKTTIIIPTLQPSHHHLHHLKMIDTVITAVRSEGRRHRQCHSHRRHSHRLVNVVIIIHVIIISAFLLRHPQMTTHQQHCHWTHCHWWALVPRQGREVMSLTAAVNVIHIILPTITRIRTTTTTTISSSLS
jgi:hypothetical protein